MCPGLGPVQEEGSRQRRGTDPIPLISVPGPHHCTLITRHSAVAVAGGPLGLCSVAQPPGQGPWEVAAGHPILRGAAGRAGRSLSPASDRSCLSAPFSLTVHFWAGVLGCLWWQPPHLVERPGVEVTEQECVPSLASATEPHGSPLSASVSLSVSWTGRWLNDPLRAAASLSGPRGLHLWHFLFRVCFTLRVPCRG